MASLNFSLNFLEYWRYINRSGVPESSGVYCVYASTYNPLDEKFILKRLLYIGEAGNMRQRLENHEKLKEWEKQLEPGEIISFSCVKVDAYYRERVEAALIYKHKPPVNTEYVYNFPYDKTTIYTSGCNALLYTYFTVYKTDTARSTLLGGR